MRKFDPKKKVYETKTRIKFPVNWVGASRKPPWSFTLYGALRYLDGGDWRIYNCSGDNYGYIVESDMEELLKLLAGKMGYKLVPVDPPKP